MEATNQRFSLVADPCTNWDNNLGEIFGELVAKPAIGRFFFFYYIDICRLEIIMKENRKFLYLLYGRVGEGNIYGIHFAGTITGLDEDSLVSGVAQEASFCIGEFKSGITVI